MLKNLVESIVVSAVVVGWVAIRIFGIQTGLILTAVVGVLTWGASVVTDKLGAKKLFEE